MYEKLWVPKSALKCSTMRTYCNQELIKFRVAAFAVGQEESDAEEEML